MSYLDEFKLFIEQNDLGRVLHLWEEYCAGDSVDADEYLRVLETLAASDFAESIGKYVEMGLPLWSVIKDEDSSNKVLRAILDLQTTNSALLGDTAYQYLQRRYGGEKYFNLKMTLVGLRDRKKFKKAISNFELLCHMDKGKFVYHTGGWGAGEIVDVSLVREQLVVEFENVAGRKHVSFENAFNTLIPLASEHFYARRFADPDAFEEEARKDPVEVIHILLRDLGPKNAAEIKDALCDLVIPEDDWAKWWQTARAKLKKDPKVVTPSSAREPFSMRHADVSFEDRLDVVLNKKGSPGAVLSSCYNFVRDVPETLKREPLRKKIIDKLCGLLLEGTPSPSLVLEVASFLENFCHYTIAGNDVKTLVKKETDFVRVLENIDIVALKRKVLEAIRDHRQDWPAIFSSLLLTPLSNTLRDYILKELEGDSTAPLLKNTLQKLLDLPTEYPDAFLWYFQKILKQEDLPFADPDNVKLFFENFLVLYHYLEIMPDWRDVVKKMYNLLSSKRWELVRKMLENASLEYVKEFLLLASKCLTMSKQDMNILRSLAQVAQPSLSSHAESEQDHVLWTTQAGYQKTHERVRQIGEEEMIENAREVEAARALGDLRENSEYKFALEKRSRLQAELKTLSDQLQMARILTPQDVHPAEIGVGIVIDLEDAKGNRTKYSILGPWDADADNNILSFKSKFAQTMMGHKLGDIVSFNGDEYKVVRMKSFFES